MQAWPVRTPVPAWLGWSLTWSGNICGFFVVFSWLFRGPLLSRKTVFGPFSLLFRGFFVAPVFGQILRVLAGVSPWNSLLTEGPCLRQTTAMPGLDL